MQESEAAAAAALQPATGPRGFPEHACTPLSCGSCLLRTSRLLHRRPVETDFFFPPKGGERRAETASDALMLTLAGA